MDSMIPSPASKQPNSQLPLGLIYTHSQDQEQFLLRGAPTATSDFEMPNPNNAFTPPPYKYAERFEMFAGDPYVLAAMNGGGAGMLQSLHPAYQRLPYAFSAPPLFARMPTIMPSPIVPQAQQQSLSVTDVVKRPTTRSAAATSSGKHPSTSQVLATWRTLRALIGPNAQPIHASRLATYQPPILVMAIMYVEDYRTAICTSTGALDYGIVDKDKMNRLNETWRRYEENLELYFGDRPLGKLRDGELELLTTDGLCARLQRDMRDMKHQVIRLKDDLSWEQTVAESPWL